MTDTAMPGLGSSNGRSAWKEASRSARRRTPEQTLEGSNPRRDATNSAEPQPMARALDRRKGTASVANRDTLISRGSSGGPSIDAPPRGRVSAVQALEGESQERCDDLGREHRQAERGSRRRRCRNIMGASSRGWQPGAETATGATALGFATGHFFRPENVEGTWNPMRGGCAFRAERMRSSRTGRSKTRAPGDGRGKPQRSPNAPAAAGHALKRMVSEESWKNRRAKAHRPPLPGTIGRRWIVVVASRTHEARGTTGTLWTST